jgi:hypothetical protein
LLDTCSTEDALAEAIEEGDKANHPRRRAISRTAAARMSRQAVARNATP